MLIKLHLSIEVPGEAAREFDLSFDKDRITIGRDKDNDVRIGLSTVSRQHAVIYQENGDWFAEDLHSTHGTKVRDQHIGSGGKRLIRDGEIIQISHAKIEFHSGEVQPEPILEEEPTSVVARRMVKKALNNLEQGEDVPYVLVMNGPQEGTKIEIGPSVTELSIGRGADCDLQLNDVNISRGHAIIRRDWEEITIEDLSSKNGVFVNGKRLFETRVLKDADEIHLGAVHLTFADKSGSLVRELEDIPAFMPKAAEEKVGEGEEEAEIEEPAQPASEEAAEEEAEAPKEPASEAGVTAPAPAISPDFSKKMGKPEYVLISLAAVVAIGLIVGIILLMAG